MPAKLIAAIIVTAALTACTAPDTALQVSTVQTSKPAPIVPPVPSYSARPVTWTEVSQDGAKMFATDEAGFRNVLHNMADLTAIVAKQNVVIGVYRDSYVQK